MGSNARGCRSFSVIFSNLWAFARGVAPEFQPTMGRVFSLFTCTRKIAVPPHMGSMTQAEVLNRRRPLSLAMIRNLHHKMRIPLESLIADIKSGQHQGTDGPHSKDEEQNAYR
jgi:hypothetical protein